MTRSRILIVEDEPNWQDIYRRILRDAEYEIVVEHRLAKALSLLEEEHYDVVIADLSMTGRDGERAGFVVLELAPAIAPDTQIIVVTGVGGMEDAVRAMLNGAYDYILKDRTLRIRLRFAIEGALKAHSLKQRLPDQRLTDDIDWKSDRIIGNSAGIQTVFEQIASASDNDGDVLIVGEESTGKRLIAQTIHLQSQRQNGPFIVVDCKHFSDPALEGELFGCEVGALHRNGERQPGRLERACGGTVFFDSIGDLEIELQSRLIGAVSDQAIEHVGGQELIPLDVRFIASTDKHLQAMLRDGRFKHRLFDALSVSTIAVPPLRERKEGDDIPALAAMFAHRYGGGHPVRFSSEALDLLRAYDYPGNVGELESAIRYALGNVQGGVIGREHLHPDIRDYRPPAPSRQVRSPTSSRGREPFQQMVPAKLRDILTSYFDDGELRNLCLDLQIDYDLLPGDNKGDKARELVAYCERHGCFDELAQACYDLRPHAFEA